MALTAAEQFAFTRKLAYLVMGLLVMRIVMDADLLRRDYELHQLLRQAVAAASSATASGSEGIQTQLATLGLTRLQAHMLYGLLSIPLPVLFLYFIYCACRNLNLLNVADTVFTPGWAVGWFLVPLLNAVRPYAVMSELWRASDPDYRDARDWRRAPAPALMLVWWLALVMAYFGRAGVLMLLRLSDPGAAQALPGVLSVSFWLQSLSIPAGALAVYIVQQLAARQSEKHARMEILRAGARAPR